MKHVGDDVEQAADVQNVGVTFGGCYASHGGAPAPRRSLRRPEKNAAFYRDLGLERRFRDVQAARFHPLQEKAQLRYAGPIALGLDSMAEATLLRISCVDHS